MVNAENGSRQREERTPGVEQQPVSRRRLLQMLGVGGAVAAWAVIPDRWSKPVVEAGDLSALRNGSRVDNRITISGLNIGAPDNGIPTLPGEFNFYDPGSGVTDSATLYAYLTPCSQIVFNNQSIGSISGGQVIGGPTNGSVQFSFATGMCPNTATSFNVQLSAGGRSSNTLSAEILFG